MRSLTVRLSFKPAALGLLTLRYRVRKDVAQQVHRGRRLRAGWGAREMILCLAWQKSQQRQCVATAPRASLWNWGCVRSTITLGYDRDLISEPKIARRSPAASKPEAQTRRPKNISSKKKPFQSTRTNSSRPTRNMASGDQICMLACIVSKKKQGPLINQSGAVTRRSIVQFGSSSVQLCRQFSTRQFSFSR